MNCYKNMPIDKTRALGRNGRGLPLLIRNAASPAAYFMQRYRKVTICALVQFASGEKVVAVVPSVTFSM